MSQAERWGKLDHAHHWGNETRTLDAWASDETLREPTLTRMLVVQRVARGWSICDAMTIPRGWRRPRGC